MKSKVYDFLNEKEWFIKFIYILITVNVIALVIESFAFQNPLLKQLLHVVELFSIVVFTIEYFLRIWSASHEARNFKEAIIARLKFIFSFYGIIDLLAFLPFYIPLFVKFDLRSIRILRLFRLLRIFKLGRYSNSMKIISNVLKETKSELFVTLFICFILMVFSSTLMYYIEHEAQPDQFNNVGQSLWWAVATLTTVGYGDIYPITPMGKLLGAFIALIGIGFVALPTGIISSSFISKLNEDKQSVIEIECTCPNCQNSYTVRVQK